MKDFNNPATRLIKQGDRLYWKNPYESVINHPAHGEIRSRHAFYYQFEDFATANPIHAIGDWPDKEEFSREEVEIIEQLLIGKGWIENKNGYYTESYIKLHNYPTRLAARYKGEQPAAINVGQLEEIKQRDINVTLLEEQSCSECRSNNYTYFSDGTKNLNHFYSCSQNPVNRKSEERKKEQGDLFQPLYAALNEFNRSNDVTNAAYSTLLFTAKQIESKLSHKEQPSPVEQFRAEVLKRLGEEKHENPLDSHTELRNDILEEAIEIVKSIK